MLKSGLTFEQVEGIIAAGATETIRNAKGGLRKNGKKVQVYFNYQTADPSTPTGKRQVRISRQTGIAATELSKASYKRGGKQFNIIVNAFRDDILADVQTLRGVQADPTATVRAVCQSYIDYKLGIGDATGEVGHGKGIQVATASSMRKQAKRLEKYSLYEMPLADVTPTMVQQAVNDLSKTHSGASVQGTISVLRSASRWCLGIRADLPTDNVVLPSLRRKAGGVEEDVDENGDPIPAGRKNILRKDQFGAVISLCQSWAGKRMEGTGTAAILGLTCGLREGECCGLRWGDVHLDAEEPYVSIRRSIKRIDKVDGGIEFQVGNPKSRSSIRNVPLSPATAKYLRTLRATVLERLLAMEIEADEIKPSISDIYVIGTLNGEFKHPSALNNSWCGYTKRHLNDDDAILIGDRDEALSFHQLRDSYASALIDSGVPILRVSHLLGHQTIDITIRRYVFGNDADAFESIANHADMFEPSDPERNGTEG